MNYLLEVGLVALTFSASLLPAVAPHPRAGGRAAQELRAGISVRLAITRSAVPMSGADQAGSLIVAVTPNGATFLGVDPIAPAALAENIKARKSRKAGQRVYLKSDARTQYAKVAEVLEAIRAAGDESAVLLTGQRVTPKPGTPVPPYGLPVLLGPASQDASREPAVHLLDSGSEAPRLEVNGRPIPWANLQSSLRKALHLRKNEVVIVKSAGTLPYADAVRVIDACHSIGARVLLATQGL